MFVSTLATALLTAFSAETTYLIQGDQPVPLIRTLRRGLARVWTALGVSLVIAATWLLFLVVAFVVPYGVGPGGVFFSLFLFIFLARIQLGWSVAVPVAVMEPAGVGRALGRSWHLTKGARWSIFSAWLALALVQWLATLFGRALSGEEASVLLRMPFPLGRLPATEAGLWISQVLNVGFSSVQAVGAAVAYGALRSVKERVSHADLLRAFE